MRRLGLIVMLSWLVGCGGDSAPDVDVLVLDESPFQFVGTAGLPDGFDAQGHRGARGLLPENTLPAFEAALDLGVTTLELDLHFTADGEVVVWHDPVITKDKCRLDDSHKSDESDAPNPNNPLRRIMISQQPLAVVQAYQCDKNPDVDRFSEQAVLDMPLAGADYQIVTLGDLFDFVERYAGVDVKSAAQQNNAKQVQFNIETKRKPDAPENIGDEFAGDEAGAFELAILALVEEHKLGERVVIQSFDHRSLNVIRAIDNDIRLAALTTNGNVNIEAYHESGFDIWSPNQKDVTEQLIAEAHEFGLLVMPWTVNETADMARLIGWGVDGLISDRPDLLLQPPLNSPQGEGNIPPSLSVFVEGLQNPVGVTVWDGNVLIAEEGSGDDDESAGVMMVAADGSEAGRLISGLPSGRDSGDLSGVPFAAVSPDGTTLFTSYFSLGRLLTLDLGSVDGVPERPFRLADLGERMTPLNAVQVVNPFDMTFDADGVPVVSDATGNGVAKETADGQTAFFHRFERVKTKGGENIEAVPTGIERVGDEYVVTLTGGCPYPAESGRLVAIDENRNERVVVDGLNMPIDVVAGADGTLWVLEFARFDEDGSCFSGAGYLPNTGRLSRVVNGEIVPVLTELNFPAGMALYYGGAEEVEGEIAYISEVFGGRVLKIEGLDQVKEPISVVTILEGESADIIIPTPQAVYFEDEAAQRALIFRHGAFVEGITADHVAMMGGGVCWLDFDKDGWLDLYVVNSFAEGDRPVYSENGRSLPRNALFNNVGGRFANVSEESGADVSVRGNGCVAADFDLDGWVDLYVTADGANALLWNEGDGTFLEGGAAAGVDAAEWNGGAAVADVNGDGLPDLFVTAYLDLEREVANPVGAFPQDYLGLKDRLYVNEGGRRFVDRSEAAGLTREERGLGAIFSDLDGDGDVELYVANDGHPNRLYSADITPNGFTMTDLSLMADVGDSGSGMGVTSGDYNGDGQLDLFVSNWDTELNAVYRNEGGENDTLTFRYTTYNIGLSGLGNNVTAWGATWADFDLDSDEDLLVVHGHVPMTDKNGDAQLIRLYGNRLAEGKPDQWQDWTEQTGLGEEGVGRLNARGSAAADFDNDGDLDVVVSEIGGPLRLLVNTAERANYLQIELPDGIVNAAATVELSNGTTLVRERHIGSSYLSSEDPRLHFGVGNHEIERVTVRWGSEEAVFEDIDVNQTVVVP